MVCGGRREKCEEDERKGPRLRARAGTRERGRPDPHHPEAAGERGYGCGADCNAGADGTRALGMRICDDACCP